MRRKSPQMRIGLLGAVALLVTPVASGVARQGDWSVLAESGAWFSGALVAAFMGLWGFMTLAISAANDNVGARKGLVGLAIVYFLVAIILTVDIILNGNSTAGIAFFLFPVFAMPVMLILILLVMLVGSRLTAKNE